jgi:hypothetical protein
VTVKTTQIEGVDSHPYIEVVRDAPLCHKEVFGCSRREVQGASFGSERACCCETNATGASRYEDRATHQPEVHASPI